MNEQETQAKYIIIGVIFWGVFVLVVIWLMQLAVKPVNIQTPLVSTKVAQQWLVQVASFEDNKHLIALDKKLKKKHYQTHTVFSQDAQGKTIKGIRVGPYHSLAKARKVQKKLAKAFNLNPQITPKY